MEDQLTRALDRRRSYRRFLYLDGIRASQRRREGVHGGIEYQEQGNSNIIDIIDPIQEAQDDVASPEDYTPAPWLFPQINNESG
jgi:hypothetical protein